MNLNQKVQDVLKQAVDHGMLAGANVLVLQDGEEKVYCDYGYRDLENRVPMSRDTIFRLYSQTKPVTGAAVVLLASEGKIDLQAPVDEYLPEYKDLVVNENGVRAPARNKLIVQDMINMTGGLAYPGENLPGEKQSGELFAEIARRLYGPDAMTTMEFAGKLAHCDLCFEPGERFFYGTGADVAGALVEKVSGQRFGDFLEERFFKPLNMKDTAFWVPEEKQHRLCKAYTHGDDGILKECITDHLGLQYQRKTRPAFESGGAGLCSTLDDYAAFATMLLNEGASPAGQIMPEEAVRYLTAGSLNEKQKESLHQTGPWLTGYTYGNFVRVCEDEENNLFCAGKGEYGWDGWLSCYFSNEPKNKITFLFGAQYNSWPAPQPVVAALKKIVKEELTH